LGKYPYVNTVGSLREFLEKIPKIGVPPKINTHTLPTLGFKSTNDRPIATILKFIDFIDGSGSPTDNYKDFRVVSKAKAVMASAIRKAYSDLFAIYEDAYGKDDKSLKDFFAPTTTAGDQVINATVSTFQVLCSFAEFKAVAQEEAKPAAEEEKPQKKEKSTYAPQGMTINLNIQLTLPASPDEKVYENIFKALRNNLLSPEPKEA
jgi:hypothetical protein